MIPVNVDLNAEEIQKAIVAAVTQSVIGEQLKKAIEEILAQRWNTDSIVTKAVKEAVHAIVCQEAKQLIDEQKDKVKQMVQEEVTDDLIRGFVNHAFEKLFPWNE